MAANDCAKEIVMCNAAISVHRSGPLVLFNSILNRSTTIITFSFLVLFSFTIHRSVVNKVDLKNLKPHKRFMFRARSKAYAKLYSYVAFLNKASDRK